MNEIKQFIYNYQNMTKEEKKKAIKESSIEFLTAACCFGKMLGIDITSEIKSLQDEIGKEVIENLSEQEKGLKIELLKTEIAKLLETIELEQEVYNYTEEEKRILDEYFEKTSDRVLENILEGIKDGYVKKNV